VVLRHYQGNVEAAIDVLVNSNKKQEEESDFEDMLDIYRNFLILKQMGFL